MRVVTLRAGNLAQVRAQSRGRQDAMPATVNSVDLIVP